MDEFAPGAARLAGLAGVLIGWRPQDFWSATPAELGAVIAAMRGEGEAGVDAEALARLKELYPDG